MRTTRTKAALTRFAILLVAAASVALGAAPVSAAAPVVPVLPGDQVLVVHDDASISTCTVGPYVSFDGKDGNRRYGAVTAGHCGANGDIVFRETRDGGRERISAIYGAVNDQTTNDSALLPLDRAYVNPGGPYTPTGVMLVQELASVAYQGASMSLCAAGATTGTRCGPLVEVVGGRIHARFPSDHGDSGGPVWANTRNGAEIVGILRGNLIADPSVSVIIPIAAPLTTYAAKLVIARS